MAQINIPILPKAEAEELTPVSAATFNTLVNNLELLILILNSTYTPEQLRNEDEQMSWFMS